MAERSLTVQEKKWQAESDARSLIHAEEVVGDTPRLKRALVEVDKIVVEKQKEAKAAQKVARKKPALRKQSVRTFRTRRKK